jgi:hypothetical protein
MPIQRIDSTTIEQLCAGCGAMHAIPIKQASIKARRGPYGLSPGDTLELELDGKPETITFTAREIAAESMTLATAAATAAAAQLATASVDADRDALRIIASSAARSASGSRRSGSRAAQRKTSSGSMTASIARSAWASPRAAATHSGPRPTRSTCRIAPNAVPRNASSARGTEPRTSSPIAFSRSTAAQ